MIEVPLTSTDRVTLIDDEDAELVLAHKWRLHNGGYACRSKGRHTVLLHRALTGWALTDHINGDRLDNRRANLREATASQNAMNRGPDRDNRSGFKGVHFYRPLGKWRATIRVGGRSIHLGYHATASEAARAYDGAARLHFGEFAYFNFPQEGS